MMRIESHLQTPDFQSKILQACGFYLRPVEETHQLVSGLPDTEIAEFYSERDEMRYIAVPQGSMTARNHTLLIENKLPVFSGIYRDELLIMSIPEGTKPMTSLLTALSRDPFAYGDVLRDLGILMSDMKARADVLPLPSWHDQAFLDTAAFVFDANTPHGARLFLTPPYNLSSEIDFEDVRTYVGVDIASSGLFDETSMQALLQNFDEGWHAIG